MIAIMPAAVRSGPAMAPGRLLLALALVLRWPDGRVGGGRGSRWERCNVPPFR